MLAPAILRAHFSFGHISLHFSKQICLFKGGKCKWLALKGNRIRLCVMMGFLESSNTQTELLRPRGAYQPHGNTTQYFITASGCKQKWNTKHQKMNSLLCFPFKHHLMTVLKESPSLGWARPTQTLINEDIYKVWPGLIQEKDEKLWETELCRSRHRDTMPKGQFS